MSVVVSLLRAIDRADGEALVMHVGEKPYVVTAQGPAELAANALTVPAMNGMLDQLLPADSRHALEELGAVEYHLPEDQAPAGMRYSIVAARGGDDIWIELRRRKEKLPPEAPSAEPVAQAQRPHEPVPAFHSAPPEAGVQPQDTSAEPRPAVSEPFLEPLMHMASNAASAPAPHAAADTGSQTTYGAPWDEPPVHEPEPPTPMHVEEPPAPRDDQEDRYELTPPPDEALEPLYAFEEPDARSPFSRPPSPSFDFQPAPTPEPEAPRQPPPAPAVVVPISRAAVRAEEAPPPKPRLQGLKGLLQIAAAHGASALHVAAQAKPSIRVDGEIRVLEERPLTEAELEAGLVELSPGSTPAQLPFEALETWIVPELGRVQCLAFRDHRGLGATFKMLPARAISAEQVALGASIQALCTEPEGLILVAAAPAGGKSTLVAALVDQINRTRRDHVITVETEIQFVHENRSSFVSQREAREEQAFVEQVRAALREAPDVLVIDQIASAQTARFALQAAATGLVVASMEATTTGEALTRLVDLASDDRGQARAALSEHLRGVIAQKLLRKTGGGRAAAREVLVNVPSVALLLAEGRFDQLGAVMNSGRRIGMVPLNDALLGLVQSGALDVREAYRKSPDQQELIEMLNRAGIETLFAERLG